MKALILYATNSGGTYFAAQIIQTRLEENAITTTLAEAHAIDANAMKDHDIIILGSNTWFVNGEEGQMHSWFFELKNNIADASFNGKAFAVFGLGDTSYFSFCKSVDHLENLVDSWKGKKIVPSLRINRFYADEEKKTDHVLAWTDQIIEVLKKQSQPHIQSV